MKKYLDVLLALTTFVGVGNGLGGGFGGDFTGPAGGGGGLGRGLDGNSVGGLLPGGQLAVNGGLGTSAGSNGQPGVGFSTSGSPVEGSRPGLGIPRLLGAASSMSAPNNGVGGPTGERSALGGPASVPEFGNTGSGLPMAGVGGGAQRNARGSGRLTDGLHPGGAPGLSDVSSAIPQSSFPTSASSGRASVLEYGLPGVNDAGSPTRNLNGGVSLPGGSSSGFGAPNSGSNFGSSRLAGSGMSIAGVGGGTGERSVGPQRLGGGPHTGGTLGLNRPFDSTGGSSGRSESNFPTTGSPREGSGMELGFPGVLGAGSSSGSFNRGVDGHESGASSFSGSSSGFETGTPGSGQGFGSEVFPGGLVDADSPGGISNGGVGGLGGGASPFDGSGTGSQFGGSSSGSDLLPTVGDTNAAGSRGANTRNRPTSTPTSGSGRSAHRKSEPRLRHGNRKGKKVASAAALGALTGAAVGALGASILAAIASNNKRRGRSRIGDALIEGIAGGLEKSALTAGARRRRSISSSKVPDEILDQILLNFERHY